MGISRTHAARTKLQDDLTNLTRIVFPVHLLVGGHDYLDSVPAIGIVSAASHHEAASDLANLLRAIADDIDPSVVTVVPEGTETAATYGRPMEDVDILTDPADRRD